MGGKSVFSSLLLEGNTKFKAATVEAIGQLCVRPTICQTVKTTVTTMSS